jgi:homopolymeric O-antigen transport system ATP-binding protein
MSSEYSNKTPSPLLEGDGESNAATVTNRSTRENAIRVQNLSKCYQLYDKPHDRLKQSLYPRLQRLIGRPARSYYREFWALKDISFEIKKGETVGVIGKNGSGKSTLLQLIVGTHAPTSGSVETKGRITALLELGSGFNPSFTGRENVYLNAAIIGISKGEIERRFDEIANFAEIGHFMDQPVKTYSSGMYVRLAFAVQVCLDPDILVVDEALAVGDAYFVHRCYHRIRMMKEQGKTILFVSHDTVSVKNLCDRAIWVDEGHLRLEGDPDNITARYRADLFGIRMHKPSESGEASSHEKSQFVKSPDNVKCHEMVIPNIDRRTGSQRCRVLGIGMYDSSGVERTSEVKSGGDFLLRITLINESLDPGTPLIVGYAIRTPRGEEVGAVNTSMERVDIVAPPIGIPTTICALVTIPLFRPGDYSVSPAIASGDGENPHNEDRVENAIVFKVVCRDRVYGLIRFPTLFSIE